MTFSVPKRNTGKSYQRPAKIWRGLQRFDENLGGRGAGALTLWPVRGLQQFSILPQILPQTTTTINDVTRTQLSGIFAHIHDYHVHLPALIFG